MCIIFVNILLRDLNSQTERGRKDVRSKYLFLKDSEKVPPLLFVIQQEAQWHNGGGGQQMHLLYWATFFLKLIKYFYM